MSFTDQKPFEVTAMRRCRWCGEEISAPLPAREWGHVKEVGLHGRNPLRFWCGRDANGELRPVEPAELIIERPRVEPGLWMNSSDKSTTYVGCHVCGWRDHAPFDEAWAKFGEHTHDPLYDIKARAFAEKPELVDVLWLLEKVREGKAP